MRCTAVIIVTATFLLCGSSNVAYVDREGLFAFDQEAFLHTQMEFAIKLLLFNNPVNDSIVLSPLAVAEALGRAYLTSDKSISYPIKVLLAGYYTEYVFKDYILNYVNNLLISSNGDDFELYAINGVYPIVESLSCLDDEANPTDETLPTTVFPLPSTYEDFDSVINYWIMLNTNGTIDDAVPPETLSDLSSPIVSAIYFKGNWKVGFPASATSKEKFNGLTKEVEMMKGSGNFEYYGDKKLQVVVLPYKGENLKMVLMVPDVDVKFEDWLRSLNTKLIERYIGKVKLTHLKLEMPKILLEYSVDLRSSLDSMRLYNVFHYNSVIKGGCTKGKKN